MEKNIPLFKVFMADSVIDNLKAVLYSGYIGEGEKVVSFEKMIAEYIGNPNVLTLNSGTAGLHLAYHIALDGARDAEIISTAITCTATNTPIINCGARIRWADVDPLTGNIDPEDIERKITDKTRAIVMVHWGGNPCEIDRINAIAEKHGLKVIEDGAHSLGTTYKNKPIGNHSDFVMHSLQAIKHITSVDGGLLITKSDEDYNRAKLLRWYGIDRTIREGIDLRCEIDVVEAGYKAHMNDVCATIGIENFRHLSEIVGKHRDNAKYYNERFSEHDFISVAPENIDGESAYWLYTLHVDNRDRVMQKLTEAGIGASKVHSRNDTHSMFSEFRTELPNATRFNDSHLCIPVGWWVDNEDREYIADKVIEYAK